MNGKGDRRRPAAVTEVEQRDRWAATFGKQLAKPDIEHDLVRHGTARSDRPDCGKQGR
jgi:hypothetical protein